MRLYSYDAHAEVADFLPAEGKLRIYRRSVAPNRTTPLSGHYSTLNRRLAVLYREGETLKFFLQDAGSLDLDGITASWHLVTKNKAQLSFDTQPPLEVVYRSAYNRVLAHIAAAPNTSREELDFGLYVSNVLKDERRQTLYRSPTPLP